MTCSSTAFDPYFAVCNVTSALVVHFTCSCLTHCGGACACLKPSSPSYISILQSNSYRVYWISCLQVVLLPAGPLAQEAGVMPGGACIDRHSHPLNRSIHPERAGNPGFECCSGLGTARKPSPRCCAQQRRYSSLCLSMQETGNCWPGPKNLSPWNGPLVPRLFYVTVCIVSDHTFVPKSIPWRSSLQSSAIKLKLSNGSNGLA